MLLCTLKLHRAGSAAVIGMRGSASTNLSNHSMQHAKRQACTSCCCQQQHPSGPALLAGSSLVWLQARESSQRAKNQYTWCAVAVYPVTGHWSQYMQAALPCKAQWWSRSAGTPVAPLA